MKPRFAFDLDVQKAETREGRPFLTLYATDTVPDKAGERCSEECLTRMVAQIKGGGVELVNSHHDAIGFGTAVDAHIVDASQFHPDLKGAKALLVDVELNFEFPHAKALYDAAQKDPRKHGFSISGRLNMANPKCLTWERGKKVFNDLTLDHITATRGRREANARTMIAASVFKSLDMTPDEVAKLQGVQAPHTLRDLAAKVGITLDEALVNKTVHTAYISGETEDEDTDHVHSFQAELDGRAGTLTGRTGSFSAGERHAHLIDLMGDEPARTSGASRGPEHSHSLGMKSVRQLTSEEYEKLIADFTATKTVSEVPMDTPKTEAAPATTETPAATASAPAQGAPQAPAQTEEHALNKEDVGLLKGFAQAVGKLFGSGAVKVDHIGLPKLVEELSAHVTPDFAEKGGDMDQLAKACVALLQRVAGIRGDRESMAVRTAKLYEVIESAGMLKVLPKSAVPEASIEAPKQVEPAAPAPAAAPEKKDDDTMTEEQFTKLIGAINGIGQSVSESVIGTFRTEGLLPKVAPAAPAAEAPKADVPPATPATPATPAAVAPAAAPAAPASESVDKVLAALSEVNKTLSGLSDRVGVIEGKPAGRKGTDGQEANPTGGSKATFAGVFPNLGRGR